MNLSRVVSLITASLLLICSLSVTAGELGGTVVSPGQYPEDKASSSSVAPVDMEKTGELFEQQMDQVFEDHAPKWQPRHESSSFHNFDETILIPIISILVVFGGGFYLIITLVRLRYKNKVDLRLQHQAQIQKFIDAGRDVPDILLRDTEGYASQTNLAKGIKDLLIGSAIVVFLTVLIGFDIGAAGLIIVAAGLARIIIWKLTQDKNS